MKHGLLVLALSLVSVPTTPCAADSAVQLARSHFRAGLAHAKRGEWPAALEDFSAAYELAPELAVLFNLAGAQFRCGKLLASNTNYRRVLANPDLTRAQRAAVNKQIAAIESRMPRLRVHIQGLRGDDRVLLDRGRVYPEELDRDLWVDPGTHKIEIVRAKGNPETRAVVLAEGELRVLALSLP
jgi:tetratricopeptide (TPR) repeat protein